MTKPQLRSKNWKRTAMRLSETISELQKAKTLAVRKARQAKKQTHLAQMEARFARATSDKILQCFWAVLQTRGGTVEVDRRSLATVPLHPLVDQAFTDETGNRVVFVARTPEIQ